MTSGTPRPALSVTWKVMSRNEVPGTLNVATLSRTERHDGDPLSNPTTDWNDTCPVGFSPFGPLRMSISKGPKKLAVPLPETES